jgi:hypothetical protein
MADERLAKVLRLFLILNGEGHVCDDIACLFDPEVSVELALQGISLAAEWNRSFLIRYIEVISN